MKPLLQNHHKKARLWFATTHGDKNHTFWRNVLWSDETKIELFGHNDHRYVWRKKEEACKPKNWKSMCKQGGLQTWLSYTSSIRRNGPKFTQNILGSLWKATRKVWPKLNNLKAMLPNTNWVYVNFWPTGNVMREIKAEINHSLYYYSDISHS